LSSTSLWINGEGKGESRLVRRGPIAYAKPKTPEMWEVAHQNPLENLRRKITTTLKKGAKREADLPTKPAGVRKKKKKQNRKPGEGGD